MRSILALIVLAPLLSLAADKPIVYGFFPAKFGSWKTDSVDWRCLTHLCFRSVELQADGSLKFPAGDPPRSFVDLCHQRGLKVTVLVWVNKRETSDAYLANAPEVAAKNLLAYVQRNNLDGVNIDDEKMGETNSVTSGPNRELVTRFFQTLRRTFRAARADYHLSYAAPPVISKKDKLGASWIDLAAIAKEVDAIIPMGYEMNPPTIGWTTNREPLEGGGKTATTTTRDMSTMVADYLEAMGGAKEKLLPGVTISFGGYQWRCRTDQPLSPIISRGEEKTLADCEIAMRTHGAKWDDRQRSPWYVYKEGDVFVQGWFNDAGAWREKLAWMNQQKLPGIAIWVIDGVNDPKERWEVLRAYRGVK